jgi:hypothetical protein
MNIGVLLIGGLRPYFFNTETQRLQRALCNLCVSVLILRFLKHKRTLRLIRFQHTHKIATQYLTDIFFTIPSLTQGFCNKRVTRHII